MEDNPKMQLFEKMPISKPVLLAFNAVNNLFGVGSSSMMNQALGSKDYDKVSRSSAFGFYCSLLSGCQRQPETNERIHHVLAYGTRFLRGACLCLPFLLQIVF